MYIGCAGLSWLGAAENHASGDRSERSLLPDSAADTGGQRLWGTTSLAVSLPGAQ